MTVKTTEIDGNKIRYFEKGTSKDTLLLLHGLGASAERWEYVIPLFAKKFKVIVPDLIGFGYSDKPMVDYTTDYFAEFVSKFVNKVGIKELNVIGSSLGGQIAAESIINHDVNVKKLVLVSPSGVMKHSTPALDAYISAALYPNSDSALNAFQAMSGRKKIDEKIVSGFVERMQLPNAKMAFMSTLLGLSNSQAITEKLQLITIPTLIVWGENDPVIPIEYAQSFVSGINDCRFYKMRGCGHVPYVEKPKAFFQIVSDFLH
jgi:pimeloyl-ACP methyl ester carboxylesterase